MTEIDRNHQNKESAGFSALSVVLVVFVVLAVALIGWYVLRSTLDKSERSGTSTNQTNKSDEDPAANSPPSGWKLFENTDMGMSFAYPDTWEPGELRTTETAAGEQGWTITVAPISRKNGDPAITFSTYPANASIRDVDSDPNDVRVQEVTTGDNRTFTLVGFIEDPTKVTKPTQMHPSTCWPRQCAPKLANGRFLGMSVGSTNNDCKRGELCPTEINTAGEQYANFIRVLESIKSL